MEQEIFGFLEYWMTSCLGLFDRLLDEIPLYGKAIIWVVFIMLVMNLLIIPIRGAGMSDRAQAERGLEWKLSSKPSNAIGFDRSDKSRFRTPKKTNSIGFRYD